MWVEWKAARKAAKKAVHLVALRVEMKADLWAARSAELKVAKKAAKVVHLVALKVE